MTMSEDMEVIEGESLRLTVQFVSEEGTKCGAPLDVPIDINLDNIRSICSQYLEQDDLVCSFFANGKEIVSTLKDTLSKEDTENTEKTVQIVYQPQALFRVKAITRCTSSLHGHSEAIVSASFSPDGRRLASGSGDTTVRFWDLNTETPEFTCQGHKNWVLAIAWDPLGMTLASGCKSGEIRIWDAKTGESKGKPLIGHKQWITALNWEPLHLNKECKYLASSSKDSSIRIWDTVLGVTVRCLNGHTQSVTCIRWGGSGLIYSGSQDRTIKVWRSEDGVLCRTLEGHAHWVNSMALNTDYVIKTGAFEPGDAEKLAYKDIEYKDRTEAQQKSLVRYNAVLSGGEEILVSGSDDFTMFMWRPQKEKKSFARMTGHQQLINDVKFSPDTRVIASASFDKSIKLWDGKTGKFITTLRGHVKAVYQVAWSADSRLLVSGSADSTLKLWSMKTKKLEVDLPGHADEVYAIDWAPDGQHVVSGGKDKVLKIWRK